MHLNTRFPKGHTYASEKFAQRKLEHFNTDVANAYGIEAVDTYHSVILPVNGRFQIIIFMRHNCRIQPLVFVDRGMCVTN